MGRPSKESVGCRLLSIGLRLAVAAMVFYVGSLAGIRGDDGAAVPATETEIAAARAACASNMRQIALALRSYAADHDGRLPRASTWQDDIRPYLAGVDTFHCPADPSNGAPSYGYNWMVAGLRLVDIADPSATVLAFESSAGIENQADSAATIPAAPRHGAGNHYAFADGHVELLAKPPNFLPAYVGNPGRAADHKEQIRQLRAMTDTLDKKLDAAEKLPEGETESVDYYQVRQSLERAAQNMDEAYNRLAVVGFQRHLTAPAGPGGEPASGSSSGSAAGGWGAFGEAAAAGDLDLGSHLITMEVENQQFADVVMRLARQTGKNIVLSPDGIPEGRIYCWLKQVTFEEALARLCEAVGAEYTVGLSPEAGAEPVYVVRLATVALGKGEKKGLEVAESVEKARTEDERAGATVLDFTGADFREVVDTLAKRYGFAYQIDPGVPGTLTVTLSPPLRVTSVEDAIRAVAQATNTTWTLSPDGAYLITPKPP
jgi:prepilin-type processing-associated H-X9-DG protein